MLLPSHFVKRSTAAAKITHNESFKDNDCSIAI